ncbi:hypothetical protein TRVL_06579 [Trypanosoma vivax]|uniref:Uncharacterized protein n=1 Tax=Trypanosoma vivax (strain Y486) TaxID=1055687 RepID=G0TRE0_TRYVY|nr:hypothetical protein TRVL_06579 [Trypanosoma vivax]CCC46504.1 hypothetical protein, unlikely [Trypanosoma vivax Y486]
MTKHLDGKLKNNLLHISAYPMERHGRLAGHALLISMKTSGALGMNFRLTELCSVKKKRSSPRPPCCVYLLWIRPEQPQVTRLPHSRPGSKNTLSGKGNQAQYAPANSRRWYL